MLRRSLVRRAYDVLIADTGSDALALLRTAEFDAIVCDLHLGDMHGRKVYATVMRDRPELKERFLFSSGGAVDSDDMAFLRTVPSISKPCSGDALAARIDEMIRARS